MFRGARWKAFLFFGGAFLTITSSILDWLSIWPNIPYQIVILVSTVVFLLVTWSEIVKFD